MRHKLSLSRNKTLRTSMPSRSHNVTRHSAPLLLVQDDPTSQRIIRTAWSGIEHLRRHRKDVERDDSKTLTSTDPAYITPERLCEALRSRGLGDPRARLVWSKATDAQRLPEIRKMKRKAQKIPYYMEKIRGKARTDSDEALKRASDFCERENKRRIKVRKDQENAEHFGLLVDGQKLGTLDGEVVQGRALSVRTEFEEHQSEISKEELFERVSQWIEEVNAAMEANLMEQQKTKMPRRQTLKR